MSAWTLDVKSDSDTLGWRTIAIKPSCDACKTEARGWYRSGGCGLFRIYDDLGRLYKLADVRSGAGWRIRWHWGNLKPREEQVP